MGTTRVLLVGGGGREHALGEALLRGPGRVELVAAPGNAGLARRARCVALPEASPDALVALAREARADLVVIGPEAPLVAGAADALRGAGVACFGPGAAGARLEGSKARAKEFLRRHRIPTADFRVFESYPHALSYVTQASGPCVVKADGLAGGKGVYVADSGAQAARALHQLMVE
ncbi:MAG TPA: phosphoribosylamine--glycine ligase, partial [Candidatus Saccharimonadales bacterium]|nr:phosphoribosylamine--glycine ligase [Candidatus Saccharimonadales bacterium]